MKRREFLRMSLGAIAIAGVAPIVGCSPANEPNLPSRSEPQRLRIPSKLSGGPLAASYGAAQVWPGDATPVLTINGSYLGPTIELNRGDQLNIQLVNQLGETSNIHWHGLNVPAEMDGHPMDSIASGTFQYSFPIQQRAGTYWYHAHPDVSTAKQVYSGFAGFFIVHDQEELSLGLPSGDHDIPLLIQDKRTSSGSNQLVYAPDHDDVISGFLGNEILVNGTPNAYIEVKRQAYRFRVLNGSNARVYKLGFEDDRSFHVIATDGGLIDKPAEVKEVWLSPGERVEMLVVFSGDAAGTVSHLESRAFPVSGSHAGETFKQGEGMSILRFRVQDSESIPYEIPGSLTSLESLSESQAVRERAFELTMDHSRSKGIHQIDGKIFEMDRSDYQVPFGDLEVWEIQNQAEGLHSMHIHGTQFQILERRFGPPMTPVDFGWKDTVLVNDNETVRLAVRFKDYKGRYLFHCHFLEHEDDGMMVNVDVI